MTKKKYEFVFSFYYFKLYAIVNGNGKLSKSQQPEQRAENSLCLFWSKGWRRQSNNPHHPFHSTYLLRSWRYKLEKNVLLIYMYICMWCWCISLYKQLKYKHLIWLKWRVITKREDIFQYNCLFYSYLTILIQNSQEKAQNLWVIFHLNT